MFGLISADQITVRFENTDINANGVRMKDNREKERDGPADALTGAAPLTQT